MATPAKAFNPNEHMTNLRGKDYLEVKWRLVWFRQDHPDATITAELVEHDRANQYAVVKATVTIPGGGSATGYSLTEPTSVARDYVANCETSAIGRALAHLGYGTQFAPEMDQGDTLADSPVQRKQPTPPAASAPAAREQPQPPLQQAPPPEPVMTSQEVIKAKVWLEGRKVAPADFNRMATDLFGRPLDKLTKTEGNRLMGALKHGLMRADADGRWLIDAPPTEQ